MAKFSKRFMKISGYLTCVKIFRSREELVEFIVRAKPSVLLVDNKLVSAVKGVGVLIVAEDRIRYKHHEKLMLLADNLANYFRVLLRESKEEKYRRELRRFEK